MQGDTILYYAYGSNLLTERIRINNPSARKVAIAKLMNYRLDFTLYGKSWHGAAATVVEDSNCHVWGVVWQLDKKDIANLDRQEFGYDPITFTVETDAGQKLECRSYVVSGTPAILDKRPSQVYKNVIIKGATEHRLPPEYIEQLKNIEDNGYAGPVGIELSYDTLRNG